MARGYDQAEVVHTHFSPQAPLYIAVIPKLNMLNWTVVIHHKFPSSSTTITGDAIQVSASLRTIETEIDNLSSSDFDRLR